jgi:UDP-N-acetyl-2-amino-2-deoxyglucuronate dehydrogenase
LRSDAHAICEKPLVLNPWNVELLKEVEKRNQKKIYTILQLRLHPSIIALKNEVKNSPKDKIFDVDLTYLTSRGKWYHFSWKGEKQKSGGVATNIGVHFFDMLTWIFGDIKENIVHVSENSTASGYLKLEKANVRWLLSVDYDKIPKNIQETGARTYRSITIDGKEIEFSGGFTDLHTVSYQNIINGTGFTLSDAENAINTVHHIRNAEVIGLKGDYHPLLK